MFDKFKQQPAKSTAKSSIELPQTTEFVRALVSHKLRLTYSALTLAAQALGEDDSKQKLGQRGSSLVKALPIELQPHVCRSDGGYHKKTKTAWGDLEIPSDLKQRAAIGPDDVEEAVEEWLASEDEPETESSEG